MIVDTDTSVLKIGILGGTFDPIHLGHLAIAQAALDRLALDHVILIPAGRPWLKSDQQVTAPEHRLAMARLAVQDSPGLEVSSIEIDRPGPTYTVDTLIELRQNLGSGADLYLVLGMDSIRELPRWRDPEKLFDLCAIVAVSRPDIPDVSPAEIELFTAAAQPPFPAARGRIITLRGPMLDISATPRPPARRQPPTDQRQRPPTRPALHPRARPIPRLVIPKLRDLTCTHKHKET